MRTSLSPLFRSRKEKIVSIIALALVSAVLLMAITPARAYVPTVANAGTGDWAAGTSFTVVVTIAAVGDTVTVMAGWRCQVGASPFCINSVTSLTSPGVTGGFTEARSVMNTCFGNTTDTQCGGVVGLNWNSEMSAWTGTATSTGAITITVNLASNGLAIGGAIAYDVQFSNGTPSVASLFCAAAAVKSCQYPVPLATTGAPGQLMVAGITAWSATTGATAACNYNHPTNAAFAAAWLAPVAPAAGAACSFTLTGNSGFETGYAVIDMIFSAASTTITTTINTMCANCGANNGTGNYLTTNSLYFYTSQNVGTVGTIDNVTIFLKAVHINAVSGTLYFLYYSTFNNKPPSAGNPLILLSGNTYAYNVINNTSGIVKTNPQTFIGSGNWFAVGVMAITTASRGSGATASGVSIAEISVPSSTEFQFAVGGSTPPNSFFSSTPKTSSHWDWIFYHLIYPVAIVTSTSTFTTTIGGTLTSTIFTTSTVLSLDLTTAPGAFTNYAEILLVILTPAMIIAVPIATFTRSPVAGGIGFVAGLMIGSGIGVQTALVPPVFLGVMVIVGVFMIVGLSRAGGGTM